MLKDFDDPGASDTLVHRAHPVQFVTHGLIGRKVQINFEIAGWQVLCWSRDLLLAMVQGWCDGIVKRLRDRHAAGDWDKDGPVGDGSTGMIADPNDGEPSEPSEARIRYLTLTISPEILLPQNPDAAMVLADLIGSELLEQRAKGGVKDQPQRPMSDADLQEAVKRLGERMNAHRAAHSSD